MDRASYSFNKIRVNNFTLGVSVDEYMDSQTDIKTDIDKNVE